MAPDSSSSKRKLHQADPSPTTSAPAKKQSHHHQQDIADIFAAPKRPLTSTELALESSATKRRKQHLAEPSNMSDADMYSFSKPSGTTFIDLTKASPNKNGKLRRPNDKAPRTNTVGGSNLGAKKLEVRNLRKNLRSEPVIYREQTIAQLGNALDAIFVDRQPEASNEELYRGVENLCKFGKASDLSDFLFEKLNGHALSNLQQALLDKVGLKSTDLLGEVVRVWTKWKKQLTLIRAIFFYLDRSFLLQTSRRSIYDVAVDDFRTHVIQQESLGPKAISGAYDLWLADRDECALNSGLFRDAINMFYELHVYTSHFEPKALKWSQTYIQEWAERECTQKQLPGYVQACRDLIDGEMRRCEVFQLDSSTKRELLSILETYMIELKEAELCDENSIADLLDLNSIQNLGRVFSLLQRRRLGIKLREPFRAWIDSTGTSIIFDDKEQDAMVVKLLELKQNLDKVWRVSFRKHPEIGSTLREAFEAFINKSKKTSATWNTDNSKPGEMIAKYVDQLLRAGAKAIPKTLASSATRPGLTKLTNQPEGDNNEKGGIMDEDSEVNNQLDHVLDLFRFVHGKAVFEAFYKKDLARRLLMGRSASNDAEKSMLARLKNECGHSFTQNLEQMFRDIELAREEMKAYQERLQAHERNKGVDLSVNILSASAWPTYPDIPVIIPPEIKKAIDSFEQVYHQKHTGRKLQWKHALAHCQVTSHFPKGKKELVVSSFQAIVLLLFNSVSENDHVSYERIRAETGLPDAEAKRTLQSLACAKLRPLTKHPKGKDINDTDTFTFNTTFTNERYRVKVNAIQLKETAEENKETHERVAADRQYETQAAIVRIMKSRKKIGHQELIAETIKATKSRGTLQPADIKKNIDKLIDKEYMERDENKKYRYLA